MEVVLRVRPKIRVDLPIYNEKAKARRNTLGDRITWLSINDLKLNPGNPRQHPPKQIKALARSIREFGWARPIGIDEQGTVLFGHGCLAAARELGLSHIPTVTLTGLSDAKKRAFVIADNQLATGSHWDNPALKIELQELGDLNFDISLTGFTMAEIDVVFSCKNEPKTNEIVEEIPLAATPVSKPGDLWILGRHRLICGDALSAPPYHALFGSDRAEMIVTDPPYNVKIQGHARGRSKKAHREFAMASGEMSSSGFTGFLEASMTRAIQFSTNGAIHYWCMDWRHMPELLRAGLPIYSKWMNLLVWRKSNAGQGSFYRSQHELIAVFKSGHGPHINNFGLGAEGRYRTNVLDYRGGATPDAKRQEELQMHPTVKPVPLIADLMRDCSRRNSLVLDLFGGSGTAILAAEETSRRARAIELDPLYVDLAIRRWQKQTGEKAIHEASGKTFDEMAALKPANG